MFTVFWRDAKIECSDDAAMLAVLAAIAKHQVGEPKITEPAAMPFCARALKIGDCFRWKDPPKGWSSGKLIVSDGPLGYALPEGWDFFDINVLDNEIELLRHDGPRCYLLGKCECLDGCGACDACGKWLGDDNVAQKRRAEVISVPKVGDETLNLHKMQTEQNAKPKCKYCGVVLIKGPTTLDNERYEARICGGCQ